MSAPRQMTERECRRLLAAGGVGRVAFNAPGGPHIVPVNYVVLADTIVFRTTPCSLLGTVGWGHRMALEIDHVDHERWRGWSVVAAGLAELVDTDEELSLIRTFWDPQPWAGGQRLLYIRMRWDK